MWDLLGPNKAINIEEWSICGGGWLDRLDRFYCISFLYTEKLGQPISIYHGYDASIYIYIHIYIFRWSHLSLMVTQGTWPQ